VYDEFIDLRSNYSSFPLPSSNPFDAELLGNIIDNLSRGKAAGLDGITAEHMQHCHPIIPSVLLRLIKVCVIMSSCTCWFLSKLYCTFAKSKKSKR
jgi:hypothetical protein